MDDATGIGDDVGMPILDAARATVLLMLTFDAAIADDATARDFALAPRFAYAALSPDGARLSYVEEIEDRQVVFVRDTSEVRADPSLRVAPPSERIRWCGWADIRYVLCGTTLIQRRQHELVESTKLYAIDATTRKNWELTGRIDVIARDQVIDLTPSRPQTVLLQQDVESRGHPQVVELNVVTGKTQIVTRSRPPIQSWMSNGRGSVVLGLGYDEGIATLFTRDVGERWQSALSQSLNDPEAIGPLGFGASDADLYVLKHHKGRAALFRLDASKPTSAKLLFADPIYDVSGPVVTDPQSGELLAVRFYREGPARGVFAGSEEERYRWLDRELPGLDNEIVGRSLDGNELLVVSGSDVEPPSLYFADVARSSIRLLGHQYPELEARPRAAMRPFMYLARDGQRIPAYLSQPAGRSNPGPAIVLPHGGPETRDVRKFDPLVQFLVAQGYAVLQMNYRGSLGYGAGFAAAGARQWGGLMHNDVTDGARWLVEQRIADPARMCIAGASYGGYAALLGAARESQSYACAASFGGLSDLQAFYNSTRGRPDAQLWRERLGDEPRALWQMSPLAFAWRIETPVLMMHGARDAVVPISQARRLARELRKQGKPHQLIELVECDHDMTSSACRIGVFTGLANFLRAAMESES